jgi:uncharacterized protein (DUF362 family)
VTDLVGREPRDLPIDGSSPRDDASRVRKSGRRRFLALAAGGAAAAATGGWLGLRGLRGGGRSANALPPADVASGGGGDARFSAPGTVVRVTHSGIADSSRRVNADVAVATVDTAMARLTGKATRAEAWGALFSPDDVVAIKVNCLGAPALASHPQVVDAIVAGLRAAGVADDHIIIYDRLTHELERAGFTPNTGSGVRCFGSDTSGYDDEPTEAGMVGSCLSRIVSQMSTAIINVPLVKDHDVAGVSIALKNHFGSINNPNKQHENRCCPQVADLNLFPPIRGKQRLIIADALTVVYDGGPAYKPKTSARYNAILAATDPVAVDAVGWDIIEGLRRQAGLGSLADEGRKPDYIAVAADAGHKLGVADLSRIHRIDVDASRGDRA